MKELAEGFRGMHEKIEPTLPHASQGKAAILKITYICTIFFMQNHTLLVPLEYCRGRLPGSTFQTV